MRKINIILLVILFGTAGCYEILTGSAAVISIVDRLCDPCLPIIDEDNITNRPADME